MQDRANHIEEAVEGCRKALTTIFTFMLSRNWPPENFRQLLNAFKSSQRVHRRVKLQLVAGAQFSLTWLRKWKPQLDFQTISKGFPDAGRITTQLGTPRGTYDEHSSKSFPQYETEVYRSSRKKPNFRR
jgi:hypothetical protein